MKARVVMVTVMTALVVLVGCRPQPKAGVVGWQGQFSAGSFAPDIPFTSAHGQQTTLNKVRQPITILAFLSMSGETCCSLNPQLVDLTKRFYYLQISVVQISLPTSRCPHGPGCTATCELEKSQLITLCDKDRSAWQAYNRPASGTVFLIDENSKIVATATVDSIGPLADEAERLGELRKPVTEE